MIVLLTIAWYLSTHGAYARLADFDQSEKSCRELGHCRSVWDIIWSCLATIFACTWIALHLNVPKQGNGRLWKLGRRTAAFGTALMAPELIIMKAWEQRAMAKKIAAEHKKDHKWTLTHGFFANMGGFVVHDKDGGEDYLLDPDDIAAYLDNGQLNMTEEEIQDKSKGDILTKGLVVLQTTWFILQLISRAIEHLPITELEIATLAFALLNGATYGLWWNKPLDVQCPIILTHYVPAAKVEAGHNDSMSRDNMSRDDYPDDDGIGTHLVAQPKHDQVNVHHRVSSLSFVGDGLSDTRTMTSIFILIGVGMLFGGIHCIALVSHFPTTTEKILWLIASAFTTILPAIFTVCARMDVKDNSLSETIQNVVCILLGLPYITARLLLLVLAFTTLRSLPPDAYATVHWTTFVPHI